MSPLLGQMKGLVVKLLEAALIELTQNFNWLSHFPDTTIFHLPKVKSDHCPLLLKTHQSVFIGTKPFHLETMWLGHHEFQNLVTKHWNNDHISLCNAISNFTYDLSIWSKESFHNIYH